MLVSVSLYAQLEKVNINDIKSIELAEPVPHNIIDITYSSRGYSNIYANVYLNITTREIRANDYSLKMGIQIRKNGDSSFNGNININNKFLWININKVSSSFQLSNIDGYLRADKWGENYSISGNIKDQSGKYNYINLNAFKRFSDEFSFAINSAGINIYFDRFTVTGNFNDSIYSNRTIAYIISIVFAAELDGIK